MADRRPNPDSMNVLRLLLLAIVAYAVWRLLGLSRRAVPPSAAPRSDRETSYEPMARCAQCGTHLPASALSRSGRCGRCSD